MPSKADQSSYGRGTSMPSPGWKIRSPNYAIAVVCGFIAGIIAHGFDPSFGIAVGITIALTVQVARSVSSGLTSGIKQPVGALVIPALLIFPTFWMLLPGSRAIGIAVFVAAFALLIAGYPRESE